MLNRVNAVLFNGDLVFIYNMLKLKKIQLFMSFDGEDSAEIRAKIKWYNRSSYAFFSLVVFFVLTASIASYEF